MMTEQIIVSLTTWHKRIKNIPSVLDTIISQTVPPDAIVLNLAHNEVIPSEVSEYLERHSVIVNRVEDTKVYKKIIPTFELFPDACVINIDDDFLYPSTMIDEFISLHRQYPNYPLTGNYICIRHLNCHCGCASLTKSEYFGNWLKKIDLDLMSNCPSDDVVYTFFAAKNGHFYLRTPNQYFLNMTPIGNDFSYSERFDKPEEKSFRYLEKRFGRICFLKYVRFYFSFFMTRLKRSCQ